MEKKKKELKSFDDWVDEVTVDELQRQYEILRMRYRHLENEKQKLEFELGRAEEDINIVSIALNRKKVL